jgi:uroporphyrinogen-III synthase
MRVVVIRPAHSGERTVQRLAALGHEAAALSLTRPIHDTPAADDAIGASRGAIAVTSAEAIRVLGQLGPALTSHLGRPLFAVGKSTAEAATKAGFATVFHSGDDGAALADLVATHPAALGDMPLLYLAGFPRAAGLEARLTERHVPFQTVECYRMADVEPDEEVLRHLFLHGSAEAALFYSRHATARFFSLALLDEHPEWLAQTRFLCLSAAIADAIPDALHHRVEVASTPDEDSLLALLGDA